METPEFEEVSLGILVRDPQKYEGKACSVDGSLHREDGRLYLADLVDERRIFLDVDEYRGVIPPMRAFVTVIGEFGILPPDSPHFSIESKRRYVKEAEVSMPDITTTVQNPDNYRILVHTIQNNPIGE
ncbi:hypothetical protein ACFLZX_03665 [Nanoarchaeota archaeon]